MNTRILSKTVLSVILLGHVFAGAAMSAQTLDFSLFDSYGRKVSSQDYVGVPIFLEFGACW